jgi:hypothetical protein
MTLTPQTLAQRLGTDVERCKGNPIHHRGEPPCPNSIKQSVSRRDWRF